MTQLDAGALAVGRLRLALKDLSADLKYFEALVQERNALQHGHDLIQITLERFTTDCSTPTFQLARNATEALDKAESERDEARAVVNAVHRVLLERWPATWAQDADPPRMAAHLIDSLQRSRTQAEAERDRLRVEKQDALDAAAEAEKEIDLLTGLLASALVILNRLLDEQTWTATTVAQLRAHIVAALAGPGTGEEQGR